jgi:hypothetical protein
MENRMSDSLHPVLSSVKKFLTSLSGVFGKALGTFVSWALALPAVFIRWLKNKNMKNWQAITMAIVVSALVVLATNLWIYFAGYWQQSRYEDSVLRTEAISQLKTKNNQVTIFKAYSENLHGLDHSTMIVAADIETRDEHGAPCYTGVLTLYDKPKADYTSRFTLYPADGMKMMHPTWAGIDARDLDGDGTKELVLRWYGLGMNSWDRQFVGIVGWNGFYNYLGTLPAYNCPEANETVTAGDTMKISWKTGDGKTKKGVMRDCTYIAEEDLFGDGTQEILCADSIWRMNQGENHTDDHNYIMTVLSLGTDEHNQKRLYADSRWNFGQPMYLPKKYPATFFLFSKELIGFGLKGFQHPNVTPYQY